MKWYEKYKIGGKVRVTKITLTWNYGSPMMWNVSGEMDKTVGRVYKILVIDEDLGYLLDTSDELSYTYWYPAESLGLLVNKQLEFSFMEQE